MSCWIRDDGTGPGRPRRGFWNDNGGELLNEEVLDCASAMDINIHGTQSQKISFSMLKGG